jgi:hypothetical protein
MFENFSPFSSERLIRISLAVGALGLGLYALSRFYNRKQTVQNYDGQTKVVISAHGDTNWNEHRLTRIFENARSPSHEIEEEYYAHLDNFAGVFAVLKGYFGGLYPQHRCRIEITYGEETDMEGAREVAYTLKSTDVVIVVDVTGTATQKNFVIEKCRNKQLRKFIQSKLNNHPKFLHQYDLYVGCPDPICVEDETNVYSNVTDFTFFFGIPVRGGDYNDGPVKCWVNDIEVAGEALGFLAREIVENFKIQKSASSSYQIEDGIDMLFEEE